MVSLTDKGLILKGILVSLGMSIFGIQLYAGVVNIGLNYPATGPYRIQGLQQLRAAKLAADEINSAGGILGEEVRLIEWDSQSDTEVTARNITQMIERNGVKMIFGGASSAVALTAGEICQRSGVPFFATLTYANEVTGADAHRMVFRECYNSDMAAKALASHLNVALPSNNNRYFYITADYIWGHSTEKALRTHSETDDKSVHGGVLTQFPVTYSDLWDALQTARAAKPDVLVLILFGQELATALKLTIKQGFKETAHIVAPSITLGIANNAGAEAIEGVISTTPWLWEAAYQYNYTQGISFVEKFLARYGVYPDTAAASAYTILYEYKAAVERAGTFASAALVRALEGHEYELLKDKQQWRDFDHQSIQSVFVIKGRFRRQVFSDRKAEGYFEILSKVPTSQAMQTREEWNAVRSAAGKSLELEFLPSIKQ